MGQQKKAATKTHNDIADLPPDEPAQDFDEESPADVLGIDVGESKGTAKAKPKDEIDERPGQDVLDEVAKEAAEDDGGEEKDEGADEPTPDEGDSAEPVSAGADEQRRRIKFERDGEIVELEVTEQEAKVLEGYMRAAETTRDKYAHLQGKYLEAIQGATTTPPGGAPGQTAAPQRQANARLEQMMGTIPRVIEAYTPVIEHVKGALPEDNELREFIEDQPVIAAILAAMWDGQTELAAIGAETKAERAQSAFRNHVDGLVNNIIQSDPANEVLADQNVRDQFDAYLVTLGPIGRDGQHDPTPVRAALMQDDGRWLAARWGDFQLRAALAGAKPDGGGPPPPSKSRADESRRRAIDPGGSSRSGSRPKASNTVFSREVMDVLTPD
jgi:hypothetical protein